MALICAYPMYQMPEVEPFAVSWWQGLRRHFVEHGISETQLPNHLFLAHTQSAPCLPYITGLSISPEILKKLQLGLMSVALDPALEDTRSALLMGPVCVLKGLQAFQTISDQAAKADALGYPKLI